MEDILNEFDNKSLLLEELKIKVQSLIKDLLADKNIGIHQISSRVKDRNSLSKKISQKQGYLKLSDVTDVVGCRIITYFEDEVDKIAGIISQEFQIDPENSVDKRKIEYDRFGYLSLHYVVSISKNRLKLTEYRKFKDLKLEIQIRSILQHGWAEIEHDIGYKGKQAIPNIAKRRFSRISALLETADLEFVRLRNELNEYEKNVTQDIAENPEKVTIDKASLYSFLSNSKILQNTDKEIAEFLGITLEIENDFTNYQLELLNFAGINTIQDLQLLYENSHECIVAFGKNYRVKSTSSSGKGIIGISIYDACYYLTAKNRSEEEILAFFENKLPIKSKSNKDQLERLKSALGKLDKKCL